jgi:hypothetical protein
LKKTDGLTFEQWLGLVARSEKWNGKMRTPRAWKVLYDQNLSFEEAAVSTAVKLYNVKNQY